jgi:DNA (cytosine-5)-methyltransferase 1
MSHDLTHASFFSGVGGLDLGLERAGWRTVSFSEIDPYASAVLAQRWPGVPNLGSIEGIADGVGQQREVHSPGRGGGGDRWSSKVATASPDWQHATLWTGGFPCQDLSVAGKRRGMVEGTRSGLAFSFLALAERYRPPIILLENVPGLLSSHGGRDMAALLGALVELGYGVGYRVLDARHFGVPQRRRRVFIVGVTPGGRAGAERAAEVLSVGSRCRRHPPTGVEAGEDAAGEPRGGVDIARTVTGTAWKRHDEDIDTLVPTQRPPSHPDGVRAPDGLAGRAHDRGGVAAALNSGGNQGGFRTEPGEHLVAAFRKATGGGMTEDPLLPLGLDSHRYRCCGNGVVADVAEWLGWRLRALAEEQIGEQPRRVL